MFRFWVAFLALVTTGLTSLLVFRIVRNGLSSDGRGKVTRGLLIALVLGGMLYLFQGPIYYHLLPGAILVLWLFDREKPARILCAVVLASAWEGLGRVNWFLLPAGLAITLYLLTVPAAGGRVWRYLIWPLTWGFSGAAASLAAYSLFIKTFHYVVPFFNPNMHYAFFKFKLWPNPGYRLGLIPGIALLSFPLLVVILAASLRKYNLVHWVRWLILALLLGVFFVGSTIVSLRAGGGTDLHNYDTFILLLFTVGSFLGMGAVVPEKAGANMPQPMLGNPFVLLGLLAIPVYLLTRNLPAPIDFSEEKVQAAIQRDRTFLQNADPGPGPVLNIGERQLVVYKLIPDADLFVPYSKIELMEMAMANNQSYLGRFFMDLQAHRFSYIISNPFATITQGLQHSYGYENDVWSGYVALPVLEFYEPVYTDATTGLVVYAPK